MLTVFPSCAPVLTRRPETPSASSAGVTLLLGAGVYFYAKHRMNRRGMLKAANKVDDGGKGDDIRACTQGGDER